MIQGLEFGQYSVPCSRGHTSHETVIVHVDLHGKHAHDFALFPDNRRCQFDFEVYNSSIYETGQWCHGDAAVAQGIIAQGIWESYETRLAVEIYATNEPGTVLDFGANMGWYTVLASLQGHDVIAFEMESETADICGRNVMRNRNTAVTILNTFIDDRTPRLRAHDEHVLFLKSDVEGSEFAVIECCWDLIEQRRVQYMMLEISPCFKPGYGELMQRIMDAGYSAHLIPDKRTGQGAAFGTDPIGVTMRENIGDPVAFVSGINQENVLMVRT